MEKTEQPESKTSENHSKAPKSAAFVKLMREVFGADQITVLYVKEGDMELGEPDDEL